MKVAISQPMNGRTAEQIKQERQSVVEYIKGLGIEVIDTVLNIDAEKDPMYYLGESIKMFSDADAVVFMPDWELARGCRIEYHIAEEYGKIIILLPQDKDF